MALDPKDHESDVKKLTTEIARLEGIAVTKRAEADKTRDEMRAAGVDVASLDEKDKDGFERLRAVYLEGDVAKDQADGLRKRLNDLYAFTGHANPAKPDGLPGQLNSERRRSMGRAFVSSEGFQAAYRDNGGWTVEADNIRVSGIEVATRAELMDGLRQRAGSLDLASGQTLVVPDIEITPPVTLPTRKIRLLDLISMTTTESDIVYWTLQTTRTLASAPTITGSAAPAATLAFSRQTTQVSRIPVILAVPREVMVDQAQIEDIVNGQLMDDVRLTLETQALTGNGSGVNFQGIHGASGLQTVARGTGTTTPGSADYNLDTIHKAITKVRLSLFDEPDAVLLHPTNTEGIMLQRDLYGRYIFEPSADQERVWGFPIISTPLQTLGTGLVGNFRTGAKLWMRENLVLDATSGYYDSVAGVNYFSAGLVAILAQIRAAFAVQRVFSFCECTNLI